MIRAIYIFLLSAVLVGCSSGGGGVPVPSPSGGGLSSSRTGSGLSSVDISAIPVNSFAARGRARGVRRSNEDIALEFIDLTFSLEDGTRLTWFTKFDGPITVAFIRNPSSIANRDLANLVARLRSEAGVNIRQTGAGTPAAIKIDIVPAAAFSRLAPGAACFVVPNVSGLGELRRNARLPRIDWRYITKRTKATIFIPEGISAQDTRDCMHEELAQALGPLNDLFRVGDSVYNDDNFHVALTSYDMLILRAIYSGRFKNGMSRTDVAQAIRPLLAQINPAGNGAPKRVANKTARSWADLIESSLGPTGSPTQRISTMSRAIQEARNLRYTGNRLAFAYYARARLQGNRNPQGSAQDFAQSYQIYRSLYGVGDIHAAKLSVPIASLAYSSGDLNTSLGYLSAAIPAARAAEDAITLFKLLALQAEIQDYRGDKNGANRSLREAIGWGKYGLASDREILQNLKSIEALRPAG